MEYNTIIGIIVPLFNQVFYTEKFTNSILQLSLPPSCKLLTIYVNNGSTDSTLEYISSVINNADVKEKEFCSINNSENKGFARGVNQGLQLLRSKYPNAHALITNNDIEFDKDCVEELCKVLIEYPQAGVVGGRLRFPDGTIQHGGAFLNVFGWGEHKGAGQKVSNTFISNKVSVEEYVTGALFFIRNALLDKLNKFDELFFPAYFEEVDYCYEARKLGFSVIYSPTVQAIHYENITSKSIYKDSAEVKEKLSDVNQIKFYLKREKDIEEYESTSDDKLLITCKIYGEWSFSGVMRNLAKGLSRNGVDVSIAPEEYHNINNMEDWEIKEMINKPNDYWNRVVLRSCEGDHMYLMPPGKKRIAHTTGESSRISSHWKQQLNQTDLVLTTSKFFKEILDSSLSVPVKVLPNAVDTSLYNPSVPKMPLNGLRGFNFCSMFSFGMRKAPEILIRAFGEEFSKDEDVSLFIHSLSMEYILQRSNLTVTQYINEILRYKTHAPIFVTSQYFRPEVLPSILSNFDVFVLPTRGEGFGLPVLEAAALGIPSITTGYSGVLDIVDNNTGWLIDYELEDIPLQYLPYFKNYIGGKWAQPSVESLRQLMRYAYNNKEEVKAKGKRALIKAQDFSINKIGKLAKEIIFVD